MGLEVSFDFSAEKNAQLIHQRNISFEEVIAAIDADGLLDILKHPNTKKYPNQKLYVVAVSGYVYLVPFVQKEKDVVFLKIIIPSRKAKKMYLPEEPDDV